MTAKKSLSLAIVMLFILSAVSAFAAEAVNQPTIKPEDTTKDRASRGMNNILYGPLEVPKNIDETKTKGNQIDRCSTKTRDGVERGIARIFGGVWQLATFWYSDNGCVTTTSGTGIARQPTQSIK